MRILILGATGMLGHMACRILGARHEVIGTIRRPYAAVPALQHFLPRERCVDELDLCEPQVLAPLLARARPDAVLNCVGLIKQKAGAGDVVEAIRVNALLPHRLARACDGAGARLVTVSTDCVFSGDRGGYGEHDLPDPVDLYGRSKLLGEVLVAPHLTLRTSMIGRQLTGTEGLLEWFISQRGRRVRGFAAATFSGLTTGALCRILDGILVEHPALTGLYHVASEPISKFDLLRRIEPRLQLGATLEADHTLRCDRSLDGSRFERATGIRVAPWDEMLDDLAARDAGSHDPWRDAE